MSKQKISNTDNAEEIQDADDLSGNDIDQLRHILFGNQARATEQRLDDLGKRVDASRREINKNLDTRLNTLAESAASDLAGARNAFSDQLAKQKADQEDQNQTILENIEKMSSEFTRQIENFQKELSRQLDQQVTDLNQTLQDYQSEARRRDDDLRQEMLTLGALLDNQKTGRSELSQMLLQMGQQLQDNVKKNGKPAARKGK